MFSKFYFLRKKYFFFFCFYFKKLYFQKISFFKKKTEKQYQKVPLFALDLICTHQTSIHHWIYLIILFFRWQRNLYCINLTELILSNIDALRVKLKVEVDDSRYEQTQLLCQKHHHPPTFTHHWIKFKKNLPLKWYWTKQSKFRFESIRLSNPFRCEEMFSSVLLFLTWSLILGEHCLCERNFNQK